MSASDSQSGVGAEELQSRYSEAENKITSETKFQDGNITKVTHADGAVDYIDLKAVGGDYAMMQRGYFRSPQFIGTLTVRIGWIETWILTNGKPGSMSRQHLRLRSLGATRKHAVSITMLPFYPPNILSPSQEPH